MAKSKLIKDTTRAEREEIIKLALAGCGNGSCDNCGSCSLGAGDPYGTYQPYIDGEMEIADINMMVAERNAKLFGLQRGWPRQLVSEPICIKKSPAALRFASPGTVLFTIRSFPYSLGTYVARG